MAAELVHDPAGRQRLSFHREGDVLVVDVEVDPGGDVPPHIHPKQEEVFEVLEGEMTFTSGRRKQKVPAGETATVPPGTRHAFKNTGKDLARMRVRVTPGLDLDEFLTATAALSRNGHLKRVGPLRVPLGIGGALRGAMLLHRHRDTTVVLNPPPTLQRLLAARLARAGERRGLSLLD